MFKILFIVFKTVESWETKHDEKRFNSKFNARSMLIPSELGQNEIEDLES